MRLEPRKTSGGAGRAILALGLAVTALLAATPAHAEAALKVTAAKQIPGGTKLYFVGDKAGVEATVRNNGRRKVSHPRAKVFLSADRSAGPGDQAVGVIRFSALKPGRKATSFTSIKWPAAVADGNYRFVVCVKKRCEATRRFEVYTPPDQLSGKARGTRVVEFSGTTSAEGLPIEETTTGAWELSFTLQYQVSGPDEGTWQMIDSTGTETISGERTTQFSGADEHCTWSSDQATFMDTADGGLDVERDGSEPIYFLGVSDTQSILEYTEHCSTTDGFSYENQRWSNSVIDCCGVPSEDLVFNGFPLSGSYDNVELFDESTTITTHMEWNLKEG